MVAKVLTAILVLFVVLFMGEGLIALSNAVSIFQGNVPLLPRERPAHINTALSVAATYFSLAALVLWFTYKRRSLRRYFAKYGSTTMWIAVGVTLIIGGSLWFIAAYNWGLETRSIATAWNLRVGVALIIVGVTILVSVRYRALP